MTITKKGWYKNLRKNKWYKIGNKKYHDYDITYCSSKDSWEGVTIHINSTLHNKYFVNTSGHVMYIYNKEFKSIKQAESYVKKIMKYHDYGRMKLKIIKNN